MHEKRMWSDACFATLTYADEFVPPGGSLLKRDLQLFFKRLRFQKGVGIRYYACGEYGELTKRPHYHAIIFNFDFRDKVVHSENGRGDRYYVSRDLGELWPFGHTMLGDVTFDSCAYVARYVMKKITGPLAEGYYGDRLPEFTLMSRRPGIGSGYYERFGSEVRAHDNVVVNKREVRPPRFYDARTEAVDPVRWKSIRDARKRKAAEMAADNGPDRRRVKEIVALKGLERKERGL